MIKGSSIPNICVSDFNQLSRKCKEFIEKTKLLFTNTDYNVSFSRHISVSAALLLQDSRKE